MLCGIYIASAALPKIVVIANSVDYNMALDFFGFLRNQGIDVIRITAAEFPNYQNEKFIVILGGPDAYNGTGDIVRQALFSNEQNYLRTKGNRKMYVKTNVWTTGQVIIILAGYDRDQTKRSHIEKRKSVIKQVKGPESIADFAITVGELPPGLTLGGAAIVPRNIRNTNISRDFQNFENSISSLYGKPTTALNIYFARIKDGSGNWGNYLAIECESPDVAIKVAKNYTMIFSMTKTNVYGYEIYFNSIKNEFLWANKKFFIIMGPDIGEGYVIFNKSLEIANIILEKTGMPTYPLQ